MSAVKEENRQHLYIQVKDHIVEHLRKGNYREGDRLPTHREFAELNQVSQLTVQKAVSSLIEEGLLSARRGKGTFVHRLSGQPKTRKKSGLYACLIPCIQANTVSAFVYALDNQIFGSSGRHMFLCNSQHDLEREINLLDSLLDRPIDALIYQPNPMILVRPVYNRAIDARLQKFLAADVPVITIDRFVEPVPYDTVEPDKNLMSDLVIQHLLDLGHRRMLFIGYREVSRIILAAWEKTLEKIHLPKDHVRLVLVDPPEEIEPGTARELSRVLDEGWPFTAIFASTDAFAVAGYRFLKSRGITCPGDVSIVGADNLEFIQRIEVPITTVWSEPEEIARRITQLLELRLGQSDLAKIPAEHIQIPPKLIVRASTASPKLNFQNRTDGVAKGGEPSPKP